VAAAPAAATVSSVLLYDGSLATTPAAQGWTSIVPPQATSSTFAGGVTLDTSASTDTKAGYARAPLFGNSVALDSAAGFRVSFSAQVHAESHGSNENRAGFSVIVLDSAHRGVELGFWTDRVFAQSLNGTSFVQAAAPERANRDTTALTAYSLVFQGDSYAFSANGAPVFSGLLRDYSTAGVTVFTVPIYAQSNFLFFGDDTGSAAARMSLHSVAVAPVPEPSQAAMLAVGLIVVTWALRLRRRPAGTAS